MEALDMMHKALALMAGAGVISLVVSSSVAQPAKGPPPATPATPAAPKPGQPTIPGAPSEDVPIRLNGVSGLKLDGPLMAPSFADAEMTAVAAALTGSWKATVPGAAGAAPTDVVMSATPVAIKEVPNTVY